MTRSKLSTKVLLLAGGIGLSMSAFAGSQECAAVDRIAKGIGHWHRLGRDHVDAPQLGAVETALPGRLVDHPLD
jgi:hypothetical protein